MLTHADLLKVIDYDKETGLLTWKVCHERTYVGKEAGYLRNDGYRYIQINGKQYLGHRLAWFYIHKVWPNEHIDHINNKRDDNRLANLREANYSINARNRSMNKNNSSGHKGVYRDTKNNNWRALISVNKKQVSLGSFWNIESAIRARKEAEIKYGYKG